MRDGRTDKRAEADNARGRGMEALATRQQAAAGWRGSWGPRRRGTALAPLAATKKKDVVVIGAGVGGIASAIRLAKSGRYGSVTVLEKNAAGEVGGRAQTKWMGGYRFDTGPSLLLFPQTYRDTFAELGAALPPLDPVAPVAYRVFYGDGTSLDLLSDEDAMAAQLEAEERGAGQAFRRMLRSSRVALEVGLDAFIARNFETAGDFLNPLRFLPLLPKLLRGGITNPLSLLAPLDGWLATFFRDPRIKALFTFQTLYVGLTPFNAPSAFALLAATELSDGVWYATQHALLYSSPSPAPSLSL